MRASGSAKSNIAHRNVSENFELDRTGALGSNGLQNPSVTIGNAFMVEAVCTFLLVIVVFETAVSAKAKTSDGDRTQLSLAPIPIGLAVVLAHIVCIPITGCSINPSRSFGPAVVSGVWKYHWIWWLAPLTGSALACVAWA